MSQDQFNSNSTNGTVRELFIQAVAAAAGVDVADINIVSVADSADRVQGRRLLETREMQFTHVKLQVQNSVAIRDLDTHLENAGLAPSAAHNWFSPHSVLVRRTLIQ
jgi:hypothetical protein